MYVDTYQNPEYYMGTGINLSKAPRAKIIINVAVIQITINNFVSPNISGAAILTVLCTYLPATSKVEHEVEHNQFTSRWTEPNR